MCTLPTVCSVHLIHTTNAAGPLTGPAALHPPAVSAASDPPHWQLAACSGALPPPSTAPPAGSRRLAPLQPALTVPEALMDNGFEDVQTIRSDPDLAPLRGPELDKLLSK